MSLLQNENIFDRSVVRENLPEGIVIPIIWKSCEVERGHFPEDVTQKWVECVQFANPLIPLLNPCTCNLRNQKTLVTLLLLVVSGGSVRRKVVFFSLYLTHSLSSFPMRKNP